MPRPTPHSFARQLGLQAIMWGLFLAALAGATQLSHSRDRGLRIGPMLPAQQFGWIKIALPRGWAVQVDPVAIKIAAVEPKHDGIQRVLIIAQEQFDGPLASEYLLRQLKREVSVTHIRFAGLDVTGQLAQFSLRDEQTGQPIQEYLAVAVLPSDVAITVVLRGVPAFGPIDDEIFQKIVDSLEPGAGPPPRRPPAHVTGPVDPIADWHIGGQAMPGVPIKSSLPLQKAARLIRRAIFD